MRRLEIFCALINGNFSLGAVTLNRIFYCKPSPQTACRIAGKFFPALPASVSAVSAFYVAAILSAARRFSYCSTCSGTSANKILFSQKTSRILCRTSGRFLFLLVWGVRGDTALCSSISDCNISEVRDISSARSLCHNKHISFSFLRIRD